MATKTVSIPKEQIAAVRVGGGESATAPLKTVPVSLPGPGEILVKINWTGLCASDKSLLHDEWAGFGVSMQPDSKGIAGHEGAGTVVAVGEGEEHRWKVGDRAGIKWIASTCGNCEFCLNGVDECHCPSQKNSGFSTAGTFQQYCLASGRYTTRIPEGVSDEEAGPIMCGGVTAYTACKRSNVRPGQWIVLPGAGGGLGHFAVQYAKAMGMRVIAIDGGPEKEALCKKLGAEVYIDFKTTKDIPAEVMKITTYGAHGVIVFSATKEGYETAPHLLRPGGRAVAVGLPKDTSVIAGAPPLMMALKKLEVVGSVVGTLKDVEDALDFTARGLVHPILTKGELKDLEHYSRSHGNRLPFEGPRSSTKWILSLVLGHLPGAGLATSNRFKQQRLSQEHPFSMDNHIIRPALGQIVPIGSFYDARLDCFLDVSLLNREPAPDIVSQHDKKNVDIRVSHGESYAEGFKAMNIGFDLAASLLSGLVSPNGMARHLVQNSENGPTLRALIYHTMTAKQDKLDLMNPNIRRCISSTHLRTSMVTHVVTEVDYGAQSILTASHWLRSDIKNDNEKAQFRQQVNAFVEAIRSAETRKPYPPFAAFDQITARSSSFGTEEIVLNDIEEALKFLELIPLHIKSEVGKGSPIFYKLLPIQMLSFLNLVQIEADISPTMPSQECLKRFIQLCDEFKAVEQPLSEYATFASKYKFCLPPNHSDDITNRLGQLKTAELGLRNSFAQTLRDVRGGGSDPETLWQLINETSQGPRSPKALSTFAEDFQWKISFIDSMLTQGATYIGYNSIDLQSQLAQRRSLESYVLFFSEAAKKDEESWNANQALMLSLLENHKKNTFFAIVDCDATRMPLEKSIVSQYDNGQEVVSDLYAEQQYMADHCFARYDPQFLDTKKVQRPTKRCLVKIPCPGGVCSAGDICEWHCSVCYAPLEYGYTDQYIYCDCGRSLYGNFDFRCNSSKHGPGFERYNKTNLLNFLKSLDQSDYLNILILGETGVGKSTFINAFVNYLYFRTLDDALSAEGLQSVIPCSFAIQTMDRTRESSEIEEIKIKVGERKDEHDGSGGDSATQQAQVYPITVGASTYRLIDTPGIGDTRGLAYDKKNMVDILATVSGYDHLHGILILLRSNNARLTAHFSFCVKELLSHLHRNATHNVVFGFTNTRISNYMPGDTFGSLKKLLNERSDIGLTLSHQSAYCFDSESFRYLAAFKQGVMMDNKRDFDNSWDRSREEAERMLTYFRTKDPHPVKSTLSLNGTRTLITQLTKPMAEISKQINANIAAMEDDVRLLRDARLTGDKLKQKLRPEISLLRKKPMDHPRTVCTAQGCVEQKDDGTGKAKITDYPNPCHVPCGLNNVPLDVMAHPDLMYCAAFLGKNDCQRCGHHWTLHMHILYELEMYKTRIIDTTIEQQIKQHASDITMKETAIKINKNLISEWRAEHEKIGDAAAKFGLWMKANSIIPINDATLAYLEVLIKAEKAKVDAGGIGNKKILADLEEDKRKHEELVAVLEASMKHTGKTQPIEQDDVQRIVQNLYNLKHFGKNLQELQIDITEAHEMTNRELPHRVQHAKRTQNLSHLPPYQTELVRAVTREVRDLDRDVTRILEPFNGSFNHHEDQATACALLVDHLAMRRNKRCLLAYHRVRAEKVEAMAWEGKDVLEQQHQQQQQQGEQNASAGQSSLSPEEEEYFRQYSDLLASFKGQWTDIDLTGSLEPPRDLFIDVRVLKDAGEIQTEYGTINLTKNSQFYVRQADVERLIAQGFLQKLG
ncbi:hypothetical protein DV736_g3947, partial [Chaetothyriales sp. CBS 134916]